MRQKRSNETLRTTLNAYLVFKTHQTSIYKFWSGHSPECSEGKCFQVPEVPPYALVMLNDYGVKDRNRFVEYRKPTQVTQRNLSVFYTSLEKMGGLNTSCIVSSTMYCSCIVKLLRKCFLRQYDENRSRKPKLSSLQN